jgi:tRNA threonylcarbamoyladenosine biosynthesis protein TsaB
MNLLTNKNLLVIDCAASFLSVALTSGDNIFYKETDAGAKHNELVMDIIDTLMKEASLKPCDLDAVLCMAGPGSFTGLRIGYSIAKGLALSLSIPFIPIPTLECIALQKTKGITLAVIQSRKNACFYAFFKDGIRLTKDADADYSQIEEEIKKYKEKIFITGPGAAGFCSTCSAFAEINTEKRGYAKEIIIVAKTKDELYINNTAYLYSGPEYIRKSDAELN